MNIRSKIILITIPLLIAPLILTMIVGILSARNGITVVATEFLTFKTEVLNNYMESQWNLLTSNNLDENEEFVSVSKQSVEDFSKTLIGKESELILAVDYSGNLVIQSSDFSLNDEDKLNLKSMIENKTTGWSELTLGQREIIADISFFEPFQWYVLVTIEREVFYGSISQIFFRTALIFIISLLLSIIMLIVFSSYLTKPLEKIVEAIRKIITTNDLSTKVTLQYKDETGRLGHYFNIMTGELEKAYDQMKKFAFQAVLSQHKEMKIRNIFQKYVPKNVIDKYYSDPESMLVGENRILAVLFSDIRRFTSISEGLEPDQLVESLNKYFGQMVEIITGHNGIVDKYIGDAIMAFFGAPVYHDNDALQSVLAGLDMLEKLEDFNRWQKKNDRELFEIGIGINYGKVTIGNIGSEKKMDYTVIGDMVNLASRLEGLTKVYKEPLLISQSLYEKVSKEVPCRMMDKVVVKGKTQGVNIYSVCRKLTDVQARAWAIHEKGIKSFFGRDFVQAKESFAEVQKLLVDDYCSVMYIERCEEYMVNPPGEEWTGVTKLLSK